MDNFDNKIEKMLKSLEKSVDKIKSKKDVIADLFDSNNTAEMNPDEVATGKTGVLNKNKKSADKRCWEGYEPTPGKKPYSKGSCQKKSEELDKNESIVDKLLKNLETISKAYSKKMEKAENNKIQKKQFNLKADHKSDKGGLTEKGRKAYNKATGSNLKKPQPEGGKRKKSFCARNKGQIDMHNIDCKKTPEKRACKARRRWKC